MHDLDALLQPRSIAIVGASATPGKAGNVLLSNIRNGGYRGRVYPINPRSTEILGWQAYPDLQSVPDPIDLAFLVVPRERTVEALRSCVTTGVRAAVIITAGFAEVGGDGADLNQELVELIRTSDIAVTGPNTIGLISAPAGLIGTFVPFPRWHPGDVAILAQTGLYCGAMMNEFMAQRFQAPEIRYSLTVGNKIGIDEIDFLEYVARDPSVKAVGLHLEGIREVDRFVQVASEVNLDKPVVVLKAGTSSAGQRASLAHTGSMPVNPARLDSLLETANICRAEDIEDLLATLKMLTWQPLPAGRRVAVVTWTGSQGVIAMDQIESSGLQAATLGKTTVSALQPYFPSWFPVANPVDIWIALERDGARRTQEAFERLFEDPDVDAILGVVLAIEGGTFPEVRQVFSELVRHPLAKPIALVIWGPDRTHWLADLEGLHVPVFGSTRSAVRAMAATSGYAESVRRNSTSRSTRFSTLPASVSGNSSN